MKEQKFRRLLLVYATAFVVALTGLARATDRPNTDVTALATSDSIGDRILALEQARNDAIIHGDAATLDRLTSDDYTFINLRGAIQLKAEIVKGFASGAYRYESRQISELKVRVYGETAVLTGRSSQRGAENGRDNSGDYRFTRVYVMRGDQWQTVAYQATLVQK